MSVPETLATLVSASQVLRPDATGWLRERLVEPPEDDDAVVRVRPDWICEIVSPRKAAHDRVRPPAPG